MPVTPTPTDRVRILRGSRPLPIRMANAVARRTRWLRHEVLALDAQLQVAYPPIEIVPVAWVNPMADGSLGSVAERVSLGIREAHTVMVVQVAAASLVAFDDDLIRGVLAHEFLHVVHYTLEIYQQVAQGATSYTPLTSEQGNDYRRTWEDYRRLDASVQAPADDWLTDTLRALAARHEGEPDAALLAASETIGRDWGAGGLPIEDALIAMETSTVSLDQRIVERAKRLVQADRQRDD